MNENTRLEDASVVASDSESGSPESIAGGEWHACCSRTSVAASKYYTTVGICAAVIAFCGCQLAAHPHDLEIRAAYLPLLSGTLMLLVDPPKHD